MRAIKVRDIISVLLSDGDVLEVPNTEENWAFIKDNKDNEEDLIKRFKPEADKYIDVSIIGESKLLYLQGDAVVMPSVSDISIPKDLILQIIEAEKSEDVIQINKWINFWTLVSMNPNEEVRDYIFWFLKRWDINITDSGLIRAYRNVDIKEDAKYSTKFIKDVINQYYTEKYINKVDPSEVLVVRDNNTYEKLSTLYDNIVNKGEGSPIYTDHHSHTFEIKLGQVVTMPREECDSDSSVSCSRGLHCAGAGWLERNYFGEVGLEVLVSPAKITAIPIIDNYGKLRCCEYFPVAIVDFDKTGHVIVPPMSLYNDIEYLKKMTLDGEINNREGMHYSVTSTTREALYQTILDRLNK